MNRSQTHERGEASLNRAELIERMVAILGAVGVVSERAQLRTYECDPLCQRT